MTVGEETLESMSLASGYNDWILKRFKRYLHGDILEVGCGIGNFTQNLSEYGKVTAIDINKEYIEGLRLTNVRSIYYGLGDIEKGRYFFGNNRYFDTIICLNVLEHIKNDVEALKNLYRLLKPNGTLVLLVPGHEFIYGEIDKNIEHFRRYDKNSLVGNLRALGFSITNARRLNLLGAVGWFISGKILKNKEVGKVKVGVFNLLSPIFLFIEQFIETPFGTSVLIIARKTQ
ncbi:class I SAM-dependent methyltransferase [Candidatus Daviesbacteria bacterium]|nr:class I SAM-dependent methyltransferase [Candidatus Daviesbacteria bacterium]